jgi:hypothetical protein
MARIFISHSSRNNAAALALRDWLIRQGWNDLFLDIDPVNGLVAADRWQAALRASLARCRAVIFCLSPAWLESRHCISEFNETMHLGASPVGVMVEPLTLDRVPAEMSKTWQIVDLTAGGELESFIVAPPPQRIPVSITFSAQELRRLRSGLARLGLTGMEASAFVWPPPGDPARSPFRGLRPLDQADAGIFFGRDHDLIRARELLLDLRGRGAGQMVAVIGPSGAGKSSFLRAGLVPRLMREDRDFLVLPVVRARGGAISGDEGLANCIAESFRPFRVAKAPGDIKALLNQNGFEAGTLLASLQHLAMKGHVGEGV